VVSYAHILLQGYFTSNAIRLVYRSQPRYDFENILHAPIFG